MDCDNGEGNLHVGSIQLIYMIISENLCQLFFVCSIFLIKINFFIVNITLMQILIISEQHLYKFFEKCSNSVFLLATNALPTNMSIQ